MTKTIQINNFECELVPGINSDRIVYMIYPDMARLPDSLLESLSDTYHVPIVVVYVPTAQWNNYLTPWPEPPEAKGFEPFNGNAPEFLKTLTDEIVPEAEKTLGLANIKDRSLMGVSLSGLFTLWQWFECDVFRSIACLSGSFWYIGFLDWFNNRSIPQNKQFAYFLLGTQEPKANIAAYRCVGVNTQAIVARLEKSGIKVKFDWVPGNHFADEIPRAERAFKALMDN